MYALCHFEIPFSFSIHDEVFSTEKTRQLAEYFEHFFDTEEAELVSVYEYLGEINDNYEETDPVPSTHLTVSIELDSELIDNWRENKNLIEDLVQRELKKDDLHLATYVIRGSERRVYFIKDYD